MLCKHRLLSLLSLVGWQLQAIHGVALIAPRVDPSAELHEGGKEDPVTVTATLCLVHLTGAHRNHRMGAL